MDISRYMTNAAPRRRHKSLFHWQHDATVEVAGLGSADGTAALAGETTILGLCYIADMEVRWDVCHGEACCESVWHDAETRRRWDIDAVAIQSGGLPAYGAMPRDLAAQKPCCGRVALPVSRFMRR